MIENGQPYSFFSRARRYRFRTVLIIAIFWTIIDLATTVITDLKHINDPLKNLLLREFFIFLMSFIMGYLFVFTLRRLFRNYPLWINFLLKTLVLLLSAFMMNFLVHFVTNAYINSLSFTAAAHRFLYEAVSAQWLLQKTFYWVILFMVTQLYIEINEKYSPGVFLDIIMGKYTKPKVENRIVMFIDLKDSTPIAEKMGHQQYFLFIREFIYDVSMALIERNGRIYQYVGDEIVVSWLNNKKEHEELSKSCYRVKKKYSKKGRTLPQKLQPFARIQGGDTCW